MIFHDGNLILTPEDAKLLLASWSYYDAPTKALWDRLVKCAVLVPPPLNGDKVWFGLTSHITKNGSYHNQCETVVRAKSQAEAVRMLNAARERMSVSHFKNYWTETGNRESLCTATERGVWAKGSNGWIRVKI